jgi:hypothetical protein
MVAFNPRAYLDTFKDIRLAYEDLGKKGKYNQNKGSYRKAYNKGLGDETDWVKKLSDSTGRRGTDVSDYTAEEFAKMHYDAFGSRPKEDRLNQPGYEKNYAVAIGAIEDPDLAKYEKGFDQEQFDTLLKKLTGSKIRQGRAAGTEQRKGTYTSGLANMMRNF